MINTNSSSKSTPNNFDDFTAERTFASIDSRTTLIEVRGLDVCDTRGYGIEIYRA